MFLKPFQGFWGNLWSGAEKNVKKNITLAVEVIHVKQFLMDYKKRKEKSITLTNLH